MVDVWRLDDYRLTSRNRMQKSLSKKSAQAGNWMVWPSQSKLISIAIRNWYIFLCWSYRRKNIVPHHDYCNIDSWLHIRFHHRMANDPGHLGHYPSSTDLRILLYAGNYWKRQEWAKELSESWRAGLASHLFYQNCQTAQWIGFWSQWIRKLLEISFTKRMQIRIFLWAWYCWHLLCHACFIFPWLLVWVSMRTPGW